MSKICYYTTQEYKCNIRENFTSTVPITICIPCFPRDTPKLEKCINSSGNQLIKNALSKSIDVIKNGNELSYSFSLSKVIPKLIVSMIKIGEESGEMVFMLNNLAVFYKRELAESVNVLTKAMEPAVIFVVAGIVGTIVIALYLPMFDMINQVGG